VAADDRELAASEPWLVVILGPTASGKTALSLALAQRFQGEIVNGDSVAMYREFDIGTAKPNAAERSLAPHHLFDCVDPAEYMTAGEYTRQARQILAEVTLRHRLPIVVGGTGLYLRALLEGLFPGPQRSEQLRARLRERVANRRPDHLHRILRRLDGAAAEKYGRSRSAWRRDRKCPNSGSRDESPCAASVFYESVSTLTGLNSTIASTSAPSACSKPG
jgi:tRNA dimethylallyltransferase